MNKGSQLEIQAAQVLDQMALLENEWANHWK